MNRVLASSVVASVCPSLTLRPTRTPSIGERIVVRSRSISADLEQRLLLRQRRDGGVELRLDALDVRPGALDLVFLRDGDRLRLAQRGFGRAELGLRVLDVNAGADRALAQRLLAPELAPGGVELDPGVVAARPEDGHLGLGIERVDAGALEPGLRGGDRHLRHLDRGATAASSRSPVCRLSTIMTGLDRPAAQASASSSTRTTCTASRPTPSWIWGRQLVPSATMRSSGAALRRAGKSDSSPMANDTSMVLGS